MSNTSLVRHHINSRLLPKQPSIRPQSAAQSDARIHNGIPSRDVDALINAFRQELDHQIPLPVVGGKHVPALKMYAGQHLTNLASFLAADVLAVGTPGAAVGPSATRDGDSVPHDQRVAAALEHDSLDLPMDAVQREEVLVGCDSAPADCASITFSSPAPSAAGSSCGGGPVAPCQSTQQARRVSPTRGMDAHALVPHHGGAISSVPSQPR